MAGDETKAQRTLAFMFGIIVGCLLMVAFALAFAGCVLHGVDK